MGTCGETRNLRFSMMGLAGLDLSTRSKSGQESVVLIFLNLLFGQSTASSLGGFDLLGGNLLKFHVSIVHKVRLEASAQDGVKRT